MAIYNDRYEISLVMDGVEFDYAPSNYNFSLRDSIYKLYPTMSFNINDIGGIYSEYLFFVNGTKFDVTFGAIDNFVSCPYIIAKNSLPDQTVSSTLGGTAEVSLIHHYLFEQTKISKAFKDEISSIINKVTDYTFSKKNIDKTLNKGYWYQPFVTNANFIQTYLLPFAYASDSNTTPFYSFITINNEYNFRNYKSMMDANPIEELTYYSQGSREALGKNAIISIFPYQSSLSDLQHSYNQYEYSFDKDSGAIEKNKLINDFIMQNNIRVPLKANLNNITKAIELYSEEVKEENLKNNNLGLSISNKKEIFTNDKVIVVCNLNTKLYSGNKVNINIPLSTDIRKEEKSLRYSGEYLIESSYHNWSGRTGTTILVLSRQGVNLPSNYRNKEQIIKKV